MMSQLKIIAGLAVFLWLAFVVAEAGQVQADQTVSSTTLPATLAAGFTATLDVAGGLRLTIPATAVTLGSISSLTGGNASGTADLNVATTNAAGYTLNLSASTTPALINIDVAEATAVSTAGYYFSDATIASSGSLSYDWTNEFTSSTSKFGFAVSSTDAVAKFKNNGSACNSGSNIDSTHCFGGFGGAALLPIAASAAATTNAGTTSTLRFLAQMGSGVATPLASGSYRATVIATAYAN